MEKMKRRADMPLETTWDLTAIYASDQAFEEDLVKIQELAADFVKTYKRKIWKPDQVIAALDAVQPILVMADSLAHYAFMHSDADMLDKELGARALRTEAILSQVASDISFLEVQIAYLPPENLETVKEERADYAPYINRLLRLKPHLLSEESESLLAKLSPVTGAQERIYNDIKQGDIQFPAFEVEGQSYQMTYNAFENRFESDPNTALRRKATEVFYQELDRHKEGTASVYNVNVQRDKILADLRGYDSVFDYLLADQEVPRELYDRQIDVIMSDLAPIMRRYARLLQKIYGLDRMTTADLKIPVDPTYESKELSFQETGEYIIKGLSPLGKDYQAYLRQAFSERWIDYGEYQGKSTGAYTAGPYAAHPYVLTSFNGHMDEVITLAHELGHGAHMILTSKNQNYLNADGSMYFSESPSTTNELIMENYLLSQASDPREKRWILSQMISATYYHNFVTHLLEAAYQREVYKIVDQGGSVSAADLTAIYGQVLQAFWGEDVEVLEGSKLTWMRQPHYYSGLYSYTYSAGLTIGTEMARRIVEEGEPAAQQWLEVLRQGGAKNPIELAAMADVDITGDQPLKDTIAYIGSLVDQIEELTEELAGR